MISIHHPFSRGIILIVVLWFILMVTVIVATLATEVRLSAKVVYANKLGVQTWSDTLTALRLAEMELLIARMPDPPGKENEMPLAERRNKAYRFNGQILKMSYPAPKNITARIFDHAGKINLQRLSTPQMRDLLANRIGNDPEQLDALLDAWQDWIDRDDLKRANGAEKDYYEKQTPSYEPRNGMLETVEELRLIKGFDEAFEEVNLVAAFTVYNNQSGINPNLATREALLLLPGLDDETIDTILIKRREKDLRNFQDFNEFMEPEQLARFQPWVNFTPGSIVYTIAIQIKEPQPTDNPDQTNNHAGQAETKSLPIKKTATLSNTPEEPANPVEEQPTADNEEQHAYMVTVQFQGVNRAPKTLMVNPYGVLPDTSYESLPTEEELKNGLTNPLERAGEDQDNLPLE
jgi:general secretion pathway protein K